MSNRPPKLNTSRKFPDNLLSAHHLLLKAKRGEKGNRQGPVYAVPAFNVTTFNGIKAAFTAFELLGSSGLLAFSNSALKFFGDGDQVFGLEIATSFVEKLGAKSSVKIATHLDHGDYITEPGRKVVQSAVQYLTSVMADNSTDHKNKV
ncbi:MAG: class II fructose-bisphosphate aldolase, partial [Candidatus Neomarinimicrobiota bacterium]